MSDIPSESRYLVVAGEASGDHHAADLIAALKKLQPNAHFRGIGGEAMRKQGFEIIYHQSKLAILGITEVIRHLPLIRRVMNHLKKELAKGVDALILVDYPGFNLRLAKIARKMGVPVIYYISPQLWAWNEGRVEKVRRDVDLMLVLFQFERDFYRKHNIEAHFVGHPLVEQINPDPDAAAFRRQYGIPADKKILALVPGSREMEVRNLLPVMVAAARRLEVQYNLFPVIARAGQLPEALYAEVAGNAEFPMVADNTHSLMHHAHLAMVASGTATLELGYLQTPMVVLYTVAPLTYYLGRLLIKISNIALVNIVLGKTVVPELIQKEATSENAVAELQKYLDDEEYYRSVREELSKVRPALGDHGCAERAAAEIDAFMRKQMATS